MSYLGSSATPVPVAFSGVRTQSFSGTGSASLFTLSRAVYAVTDIEVIVNNVQQSPFDGSYSIINNGLGLQFSESPSVGTNNIYVIYRDQPIGSLYDTGAVRKAGDTMTGGLAAPSLTSTGGIVGNGSTFDSFMRLSNSGAGGQDWWLFSTMNAFTQGGGKFMVYNGANGHPYDWAIDSAGRVTAPNQPAFATGKSGNMTSGNVIVFDSVEVNIGGHYNSSNGRFTAPVAGVYQFSWQFLSARNTTVGDVYVDLRKNGSGYFNRNYMGKSGNSSSVHAQAATSDIIQLAAGDYVDLYYFSAIGDLNGATQHNRFSGHLIG